MSRMSWDSAFRYGADFMISLEYPSSENKNNDHDSVCLAFSPPSPVDPTMALALPRRKVARTEMHHHSILMGRWVLMVLQRGQKMVGH